MDRVWLLGVYSIIFAFGMAFGCMRKDWRDSAQARALSTIATQAVNGLEQCVTTLDGTGRAAAVLAGTERGYARWRQAAQRQVRQQSLQQR